MTTLIRYDIFENSTLLYGGGVFFENCNYQSSISQCLISGNCAFQGGGLYFEEDANPIVGGEE